MQTETHLRTRRRSLLWPTLFSLVAFALFMALGLWQVHRLHWKEGLIAERQAAVSAPAIALPATLDAARGLQFRHVEATGRFDHAGELYLNAMSRDGKPGWHVVTPLIQANGEAVMIDRGFVPTDKQDPATRAAAQWPGTVTVTGLLRVPPAAKPSWFLPDNDPAQNHWFYIDIAAMAAADRLARVAPLYIDADATPNPGGYPEGGQTNIALPNDHLQYAITWFGLAALMPVLYFFFVRRHRREMRR
jgi:surfeit locus 1 family protein